jgi:hypothetical protein
VDTTAFERANSQADEGAREIAMVGVLNGMPGEAAAELALSKFAGRCVPRADSQSSAHELGDQ